jgi:hypothetical protein
MKSGRTMKLRLHTSFVLLLLVLEMRKIPQVQADKEELKWWQEDDWSLANIWDHLECSRIFNESERPIYDLEMWMTLRRVYRDHAGENSTFELTEQDGFSVAVEAKQSPGKGRSIYAAQDIRRGDHIACTATQEAEFDSGTSYKRFLATLPEDMACDLLIWAYVLIPDENVRETARIYVDLEIGALMNSVYSPEETTDAGCLPEWNDLHPGGCGDNIYALRDIRKGQEILMDYDSLVGDDYGWEWFGFPGGSIGVYFDDDDEEDDTENKTDCRTEN